MVRLAGAALAAALAATILSGCAGTTGAGSGSLTREVSVDLLAAEDAEDPFEALAQAATTTFVYRHEGGTLAVDGAKVEFLDTAMEERSVPLSRFVDGEAVREGDVVTIEGAAPFSHLRILSSDGGVVAARDGAPAEWLEAGGYPLPVAVEPGMRAQWRMSAEASLRAGVDGLRIDEEEGSVSFEDGAAEASFRLEVDAEASARESAGRLTLSLGLDGTFGAEGEASVTVSSDAPEAPSGEFGGRGSLDASGKLAAELRFDGRSLDSYAVSGSIDADAELQYWNDEHPRSAPETVDLPQPLLDESFSDSGDFDFGLADPEVERFLAALWAMDLAPGDRFAVGAEVPLPMGEVSFRTTTDVVREERIEAAGRSWDALRIETRIDIDVPFLSSVDDLRQDIGTSWVDVETHVPLRSSTTFDFAVDVSDFRTLLTLAASQLGDGFEPPSEAYLEFRAGGELELESLEGDLELAASLPVMGAILQPMWFSVMGPALGFAGMGAMGGFEDDYAYPDDYDYEYDDHYASEPPSISLTMRMDDDGAGAVFTVVAADEGADWIDILQDGTAPCDVPYEGPVRAGESVDCSDAESGDTFELLHMPSGTLLYAATV